MVRTSLPLYSYIAFIKTTCDAVKWHGAHKQVRGHLLNILGPLNEISPGLPQHKQGVSRCLRRLRSECLPDILKACNRYALSLSQI